MEIGIQWIAVKSHSITAHPITIKNLAGWKSPFPNIEWSNGDNGAGVHEVVWGL